MKSEMIMSEFKNLYGIEYFDFEEDFIEENVRCIPMIVRFKMDAAGIKLKLSEWSRFSEQERVRLALMSAISEDEVRAYKNHLIQLVFKYTGEEATLMQTEVKPEWAELAAIPAILEEKAKESDLIITVEQWRRLTDLQRFSLLKLCKQGHESKNFSKAIVEFGLIKK